jgi:hypothetical protein
MICCIIAKHKRMAHIKEISLLDSKRDLKRGKM